jgi:hypothetical protein
MLDDSATIASDATDAAPAAKGIDLSVVLSLVIPSTNLQVTLPVLLLLLMITAYAAGVDVLGLCLSPVECLMCASYSILKILLS